MAPAGAAVIGPGRGWFKRSREAAVGRGNLPFPFAGALPLGVVLASTPVAAACLD